MVIEEEHPNFESHDAFTIYMGALSCMRHRGEEFYELQRRGRLAYLILNDIDYITGDYIAKLKEAVRLVKEKHDPSVIQIAAGCQGTLLSTDYDMLKTELEAELKTKILIDKNCHLLGFDGHNRNHDGKYEHQDRKDGQDHGAWDGNRHGGHGKHGHNRNHDRRDHGRRSTDDPGRGGRGVR